MEEIIDDIPNDGENNDTTATTQYENDSTNELVISFITKEYLSEIGKWTKFMSILGFIGIGLLVLAGFFMGMIFTSFMPSEMMGNYPVPMGAFGGIYVVMAAIYFFPVYYLFNFSTKINTAIKFNDSMLLDAAFKNLKSHYKFIGVLMIVMMSLYFVAGIGGFIIASMF